MYTLSGTLHSSDLLPGDPGSHWDPIRGEGANSPRTGASGVLAAAREAREACPLDEGDLANIYVAACREEAKRILGDEYDEDAEDYEIKGHTLGWTRDPFAVIALGTETTEPSDDAEATANDVTCLVGEAGMNAVYAAIMAAQPTSAPVQA